MRQLGALACRDAVARTVPASGSALEVGHRGTRRPGGAPPHHRRDLTTPLPRRSRRISESPHSFNANSSGVLATLGRNLAFVAERVSIAPLAATDSLEDLTDLL